MENNKLPPRHIVMMGPPGSGKGTQSAILSEKLGINTYSAGELLREATLSGTPEGNAIKEIIDKKKDVAFELANPVTIEFNSLKDKVWLEVHRMKGFLRFTETDKGVLSGQFSPDNDILELLAPHFMRRYKFHNFALHDVKRNKVILYDTKGYKIFSPTQPLTVYIGEVEEKCRSLYREYFDAVNIKSRPHEKQQRGYLPLRYRKNMTEFTTI